jgi:simple sugar transport system permease protein
MRRKPDTRQKRRGGFPLLWPLAALALLLLYNAAFTPGFMTLTVRDGQFYGSLVDILNRGAPIMLVAIGMTLVISTRGVDLSVGAVIAISGAIAAWLIVAHDAPPALVILVTLIGAALCGLWNGALVAFLGIQPIVATLILMVAGRGIAQLITQGQIMTFHDPVINFIAGGSLFYLPFAVTIVVVTLSLTAMLMRWTALGLFIEAVGANEPAAHLAGVNTTFVKVFVYTFCGICAGIAGLIAVSNISGADSNNAGLNAELDGILATVIGGTSLNGGRFFLIGSIVGALIIQTLTTTILSSGVPPHYTLVVKSVVVLAVCLLQSDAMQVSLKRLVTKGGAA